MAEVQIGKVSHKHEAILNWMLLNPEQPLYRCAQEFGVTQAWLSVVINSDLFQQRLAERQDGVFEGTVLTLRQKLAGVAECAVERLGEKVSQSNDPAFLLQAADKTLKALGYGGGGNATSQGNVSATQNNFFFVDKGTLGEARKRMEEMRGAMAPEEKEVNALPAT